MGPEVSVILPVYNRPAMAADAIDSVLAQRDATFELIVVDDGSTDETARRIALIAARPGGKSCNRMMRTIRIEGQGPAAARNRGVALARAPLLAFLDSDDLWAPDKLARQLAFMRDHPGCAISQTGEAWIRRGRRVNPGRCHLKRAGDIFIDSLRTCLISPSAVILRAGLFRAVGGFDEDMAAAEDYDLWLRILVDHQVGLLEQTLVTRRAGHTDQLSATIPALDRFRILALLKLLADRRVAGERRKAVVEVLTEKCEIYARGLLRRGAVEVARFYQRAARDAQARWVCGTDEEFAATIAVARATLHTPATGEICSPTPVIPMVKWRFRVKSFPGRRLIN